jgi:hypothetical protein
MQKTVLSLSVAAALAVPTLASAQAPAVPTLDKVLEASGLSMSGYIDAAYTHSDRNIQGGFSPRVFDSYNNSFVLHQVGLQIAKQPKSGVGGLVNVTAGRDATVIHSSPDTSSSTFDITQGFLQYATGPITVMAGKFTTLHGTEVIWSPSNANYSRSLLFGSVPFTHTGVRVNMAPMDNLTVTAGLNNGWDQLTDSNRDKTLELGVTATPIKPLSLAASYYGGKEIAGTVGGTTIGQTGMNGRRDSLNLVGSYTIIDPLSVGLEYLYVKQKESVFDSSGAVKDGKYSGIALYLGYAITPKVKTAFRFESLNDKDGLRFPLAASTAGTEGTKHREITATLGYAAADNLDVRFEVRQDRANEAVYSDDGALKKTMMTFALQGIYKF